MNSKSLSKPLYVEDMSPTQQAELEVKMQPGQASESGFLAPGEGLVVSAKTKREMLQKYGISFAALADRIDALKNGLNQSSSLRVKVVQYRGSQACPFPSCPHRGAADIHLTKVATGKKTVIPTLMSHLVRDHHFLEGNVPYGLDPQDAVELLELDRPLVSQKAANVSLANDQSVSTAPNDFKLIDDS